MPMTLLYVFVVLAILAVLYWGLQRLTLPEPIKTVVIVIAVIFGLLYVLQLLTGTHYFPGLR